MLIGVDVGGTFTDAVVAARGRLITAKAPTTPHDQSEGVLAAVRLALQRAGAEPADVRAFAHGTTVATNALLEGRGARTVLVTTAGFEDVVELGRQARAHLYRLCEARPAPLIPPQRRVGADERTGPDGVLRPLAGLDALVARIRELEPEAVAVCLLHAYRHPEHERAIGEALGDGVHVSLSSETVGTFREYERAATTEVDAALSPLLSAYLHNLVASAAEAGLPEPSVMQSSGGLTDAAWAGAHAATTVLSGPAGGAAGAAWAAREAGEPDALCFDMGGTSCDVCLITGGGVQEAPSSEIGGRPIALPTLDIHTVGAGGGSIAWADAGGALRAGPRSAGARPGPAAYGHGGTEPTVTDANVVLGHLGGTLAGSIELDADAAHAAVGRLAGELGMDVVACAQGIRDVAVAEMVRALRVITVERGVDPRGLALMAFGGAGPLHAAAVAEALGMERILCPRASGVLAALGLVVSDRRRDVQRSAGFDELEAVLAELRERAGEGEIRTAFDLRYRGQSFELTVHADPDPDLLREAFAAAHEQAYGYRDPEGEIELVTVRVTAIEPGPGLEAEDAAPETFTGPALIALPESTVVVPEGWRAEMLRGGTIRMVRS
jgi:N-methylhydantoinase A